MVTKKKPIRFTSLIPKRFPQSALTLVALVAVFVGLGVFAISRSQAAGTYCTHTVWGSGSSGGCVNAIQDMTNDIWDACASVYHPYNVKIEGQTIYCYNSQFIKLSPLRVDGDYGPATKNFVYYYQKATQWNFLTADGVVGPATWRALCADMHNIISRSAFYENGKYYYAGINGYNRANCGQYY